MNHLTRLTATALVLTLSFATAARAENLEQTQQLLSTKQCPSCDLSGAGLSLAKLQGANLAGANLSRINLSQADLTGTNLSGANLVGASLAGANLAGANLAGADLRGADLRRAFLGGAEMSGALIQGAMIQDAIAIPDNLLSHEDFYRWAMAAGQEKRYEDAIQYFNQSLTRKADFAPAWLGRGLARFELGQKQGAIEDLDRAIALFKTQGDQASAASAQKALDLMKNPPKEPGTSFGQGLVSVLGGLLQLFLLH